MTFLRALTLSTVVVALLTPAAPAFAEQAASTRSASPRSASATSASATLTGNAKVITKALSLVQNARAQAPASSKAQSAAVISALHSWQSQIGKLSGQVAKGKASTASVATFEKRWVKADVAHWSAAYASLLKQAGQLANANAQAATWSGSTSAYSQAAGNGLATQLAAYTKAHGNPTTLAKRAAAALLGTAPSTNFTTSPALAPLRKAAAKPVQPFGLTAAYSDLLNQIEQIYAGMIAAGNQMVTTLTTEAATLTSLGYNTNANQLLAVGAEIQTGMPVLANELVTTLTSIVKSLANVDITDPSAIQTALAGQTSYLTSFSDVTTQLSKWQGEITAIINNLTLG